MKSFKIFILLLACLNTAQLVAQSVNSKTEIEQISATLMDYIEGTANGEPDRVKRAFHEDLELYHVANDTLVAWSGMNYANRIKEGKKSNRIGKIVSIDFENNAATS